MRDALPVGTFFRNHEDMRQMIFDGGIEFLEEGHPLAVVVAAVFVRRPRPLVKVQVKHVRHGIHPQTIQVTFLKPEHGVGNEEALDLVLT